MRKPNYRKAELSAENDIYQGQSIEQQMRVAQSTKQPIEATSPPIYTPREDGVVAAYNIRTDRFEVAQDAMDKVAKSYQARRAEYIKQRQEPKTGTNNSE